MESDLSDPLLWASIRLSVCHYCSSNISQPGEFRRNRFTFPQCQRLGIRGQGSGSRDVCWGFSYHLKCSSWMGCDIVGEANSWPAALVSGCCPVPDGSAPMRELHAQVGGTQSDHSSLPGSAQHHVSTAASSWVGNMGRRGGMRLCALKFVIWNTYNLLIL